MIKELLNYQQADAKLREIESELAQDPARKTMLSAKNYLEGVEENVNKLDDNAASLNNDYQNLIEKQSSLNEQLEELQKVMQGAQDESEIIFLSKKADELLATIKSLSATINALGEELQKVIKEYATIRNNTKNAQTKFADAKEEYNKHKGAVKGDMDAINKELEQLKSKVDPVLMEKYLKKRANKLKHPIVVELVHNICGYCNMELSMSETTKLDRGEIIECEHCQRLIYKKTDK